MNTFILTGLEVSTQVTIIPWCHEHDSPLQGGVHFYPESPKPGAPYHFDDGDLVCLGPESPHRLVCKSQWFLKVSLSGRPR